MSESNEKQRSKKVMPVSPGRPKGVPNKTTKLLKEAILEAGEKTGADGNGKDGLVGYLQHVAATNVPAFSTLLGKVLPMQVTGDDDGNGIQIIVKNFTMSDADD